MLYLPFIIIIYRTFCFSEYFDEVHSYFSLYLLECMINSHLTHKRKSQIETLKATVYTKPKIFISFHQRSWPVMEEKIEDSNQDIWHYLDN